MRGPRLASRLICLVLVATLALLSPGPQAYAALVDAIPAPEGAPQPVVPKLGPLGGVGTALTVPDLNVANVSIDAAKSIPGLSAVSVSAQGAAVAVSPSASARSASAVAHIHSVVDHTMYASASPQSAASSRAALADGAGRLERASEAEQPRVLDAMYVGSRANDDGVEAVRRDSDDSGKTMPEREGELEPSRHPNDEGVERPARDVEHPRRENSDNPDRVDAPGLFGALPAVFQSSLALKLGVAVLAFVPILGSLILHEMGHAKMAAILGDDGPRRDKRLSWTKEGLKSHIDPVYTVLLPLVMMAQGLPAMGWAKQIQTSPDHSRGAMALIALAGPAVNIALLGVGLVAAHALAGLGAPALVLAAVKTAVVANAVLAVFNLIPLFPLDGHWLLRAALPQRLADRWDRFNDDARIKATDARSLLQKIRPYIPLAAMLIIANATGLFAGLLSFVGHLVPLALTVPGVSIAGAALPAIAAAGLMIGQLRTAGPPLLNPGKPVQLEASGEKPVELIVVLGEGAPARLTEDLHLSNVDLSKRGGVGLYAKTQQAMLAGLAAAGVSADALAAYGATPIATYRRINAATLRVDVSRAAELRAALEAAGHKVFDNKRRKIIAPVPNVPESADPSLRSPVTMDEVLSITKADAVHRIATERWGAPDRKPGLLRRLFGQTPAQTPIAVIDSGADTSHAQLKQVKKVVNVTSGENRDDIGHGSWVTSMVLNFAKWNRNLTHYKTFVDGSASTDDILKALTAAGNDGNLVISNSWGDNEGDPNGPDSQLVLKLAKEGHVLVFAAGNAGPGANTIGSPAIVYFDAGSGALRVVSVAAAGRDKKVAYFSSRGERSPKTQDDPNYPPRPDATAIGANVEGAWPQELGPDRVDSDKGPVKAISGTSMSTPDVAGAIALLCMLFGVTTKGDKLDAVVRAVVETLEPTGQGQPKEGRGFLNVEAAFKRLEEVLTPKAIPSDAAREYARLLVDERAYQARRAYLNAAPNLRRYDEDIDPKLQALADVRAPRLRALEARYPKLRGMRPR